MDPLYMIIPYLMETRKLKLGARQRGGAASPLVQETPFSTKTCLVRVGDRMDQWSLPGREIKILKK